LDSTLAGLRSLPPFTIRSTRAVKPVCAEWKVGAIDPKGVSAADVILVQDRVVRQAWFSWDEPARRLPSLATERLR
jgi:hypothetical protein